METTHQSAVPEQPAPPRLLLIDTCGEVAALALSHAHTLVAQRDLPGRTASAHIVAATRNLLAQADWSLHDLTAVGAVNGPGSFTGLRTGLAAAKGFCEAAALAFVAVSRLAVLAEAAGPHSIVALDAGRGSVYLRIAPPHIAPQEMLCTDDALEAMLNGQPFGQPLLLAEERLQQRLQPRLGADRIRLHPLTLTHALPALLRALAAGPQDVALADANYVRSEHQIYARSTPQPIADPASGGQ